MLSVVVWAADRAVLERMVHNCGSIGVTHEVSADRWLVEFGDDHHVFIDLAEEIWEELEEEGEQRILSLFPARPVPILFEYLSPETGRLALIAALDGVDAQVEDLHENITSSDLFRQQLQDGSRRLYGRDLEA
jgi:hypothetical protein